VISGLDINPRLYLRLDSLKLTYSELIGADSEFFFSGERSTIDDDRQTGDGTTTRNLKAQKGNDYTPLGVFDLVVL